MLKKVKSFDIKEQRKKEHKRADKVPIIKD